jgi:hypothetical protein
MAVMAVWGGWGVWVRGGISGVLVCQVECGL